jgi:hypothetical protein
MRNPFGAILSVYIAALHEGHNNEANIEDIGANINRGVGVLCW